MIRFSYDFGESIKPNHGLSFYLLLQKLLYTALPNLQELWIQGNQWKDLPASVSNLDSLELLHANGNNFEELPNEINNMKSLERIFIRDNPVVKNFSKFIDTTNVRVITNR